MIGTSVRRYEIVEELGQGGMSVVYRGRDTTLDRDVAVKVLHSHLADDEENRVRFRREARAIARLQHPHVVDVYDYSDEEDEESFIVMEYIPGENLRSFVQRHGFPPPEVAAMVGWALADALSHAHEHGVIHRDLKPENVMVADDGRLKLMDFGIAHVADEETVTQTGSLLGSPAHMAPEIIDGYEVNRRSDIFSLGTVLYWLSTGEFPFEGDNASALLRQVLECNYEDPEAVESRMPRSLARVIDRCLSREPEERFDDVDQLRDALAETLEPLGEVDAEEELGEYLEEPEAYTDDFRDRIVDRLMESGRAHLERDEIPRAVAQFNRVLAYDPGNDEVLEELDNIDQSRTEQRQRRVLLGVGAAVVVLLVGYFGLAGGTDATSVIENSRSTVGDASRAAARRAGRNGARHAGRRRAREVLDRSRSHLSRLAGKSLAVEAVGRARNLASRTGGKSSGSRDSDETEVAAGAPRGTGGGRRPTGRRGADAGRLQPDRDAGTARVAAQQRAAPETYTYKFKVLPLAATVYIDGERMSAPRALRGVELAEGRHRIKVVSPGCHPYESEFEVDGPRDDALPIKLEWKDATIHVQSNRPAVVYVDGRDDPRPIGSEGEASSIEIPFGEADGESRGSRREVTLEIRPRDDMELVQRETVTLRPGEERSINVSFSPSR